MAYALKGDSSHGKRLKGDSSHDKRQVSDRDGFDTLPLSMILLETQSLRSARLVKNSQMETMVELHSDAASGSLQIRPQDVEATFPGCGGDQATISKLAELKSFDIYSLRNSLQKLGVNVDAAALELSGAMRHKLDAYSVEFTRPLLRNIFGSGGDVSDREDLTRIFRDPNVDRVRARLKLMAQKTGIPVEEIPVFLRNYGELFLSVAYYRYNFDSVAPDVTRFMSWLEMLKKQRDVNSSPVAMASCRRAEDSMRFLVGSAADRLTDFNTRFELFWGDMNRKSFKQLRRKIEDDHVSMGALMCGLMVKIRAWSNAFPDSGTGSTAVRLQYLMVMTPGLERLKAMESDARLMTANF